MTRRNVLSIGNFDGVHFGHRALLEHARRVASTVDGGHVIALTFDPHPAKTLKPGAEPPRVCSLHEKVARLKEAGADEVVVLNPTPQTLGQPPTEFMRELAGRYQPLAVIEGEDFRFGKAREGDVSLLRELGDELGFDAIIEPKVQVALDSLLLAPVSSTLIRWLVGHGRTTDAARCLGCPFQLIGDVATGEQRGRTIGVPTANLDPTAYGDHIVPVEGVYAGDVILGAAFSASDAAGLPRYPAAISVGNKPTFGKRQLTIEAHLLDYAPADGESLYGQTMTIRFAHWLREQYAFDDVQALKAQLNRDIAEVRRRQPLAWLDANCSGPEATNQETVSDTGDHQ